MANDALMYFGPLDDLAQVVYQGPHRFFILSEVNEQSWTLHVGTIDRWWCGSWSEQDILAVTGHQVSSMIIEGFADKLAEAFVRGELNITNWDHSNTNGKPELRVGPTSREPIVIPLKELAAKDVVCHATNILTEIALQAQGRKCRLNPTSFASSALSSPPAMYSTTARETVSAKSKKVSASDEGHSASTANPTDEIHRRYEEEIRKLKLELAKAQRNIVQSSKPKEVKPTAPVKRPPQGASLANLNRKARKYQAVEFESDEE